MITPSGLPAWSRTADHQNYGGHTSKVNYQSQGVTNPRTDVGAEAICRHASDTAAAVRTSDFAKITFLNNDGSPAAPTVESVEMMTGVTSTPYAGGSPTTGFPGATRSSTGVTVFTFDSSYVDDYGVSSSFAPTMAMAVGHGSSFVNCTCVVSGQTVTVYCWDAAGVAVGDKRVTLTVS